MILSKTPEPARPLVLVVEDDADIRESLEMLLEGEGYQVAVTANGREGLERLRKTRPSVVILDLLMPVMNGFEFLAQVKADPTLSTVPIVAISAGDGRTGPAALQAGADQFIPKPLKLDALLSAVERYC